MKRFNGKAIYNPSGKAGEYSYWACNFFVGCSNGCTYCYCKKGILAGVMGQDKPQLKKCFKDEDQALKVFEKELIQNLPELQKHGVFFTFTSDPMLPETKNLTKRACSKCVRNGVPIKILTKRTEFVDEIITLAKSDKANARSTDWINLYAIGFTLTGHDELEPGASTNVERIEAMRKLHEAGFKTWASIEPIIDLETSLEIIRKSYDFCDLFKIGLESGKKYDKQELQSFICKVLMKPDNEFDKNEYMARRMLNINPHKAIVTTKSIYFKDSLLKAAGCDRGNLPSNCVERDFNIFNQ